MKKKEDAIKRPVQRFVMPEVVLFKVSNWESSCDNCTSQEEGRHYCCLYSVVIKNMDIWRCADYSRRLA